MNVIKKIVCLIVLATIPLGTVGCNEKAETIKNVGKSAISSEDTVETTPTVDPPVLSPDLDIVE